jgi:hypothetical protein
LPVNFQQALQQIRDMGSQATQRQERLEALRAEALQLFHDYAAELDTLEQLVDRAAAENPSLRCAAPADEVLDEQFAEPPPPTSYTLLAADGSQINPDGHAMVEFGAINVGAIRLKPGQGAAPEELVQSTLLFHEELYTSNGSLLTDDIVALKRDLAERRVLAELARSEQGAVLALTDGPLELFREPRGMQEFEEELARYTQVLHELARLSVGTAGYVDRPRGDLVVRLFELVLLQRGGKLNRAGQDRPLRGVYDRDLMRDFLRPGERSAIFAIHSGSAKRFQGDLALHFFYLNVGRQGKPYLSRVEIPRWVAENRPLVDLLHACLLAQSRHLGVAPYPYILHRAHEIAVISFDERRQLETMIAAELRRHNIETGEVSSKQNAKDKAGERSGATNRRMR